MSNNINTKATTFWIFLKDNTIEIPIIQRDYAQGRLGKENLRKNFLSDLKKALDNEKPYKNTAMKLDFVYGSTESGKLNPLDGQQRLTTLWLLHWYIALRAGELNEDNCRIFRKFTYETRISSREFCQNLCNPEHFENFDGNDIVGFITKQTWFYSAWKQDPTIQSMLRMLGGTKVTDKKGEDIVDGIEEKFTCPSKCDIDRNGRCALKRLFERYWEKLISENAPIVFYHLPLRDFGLSDDLYIKMNARGKQLTSFENFKADLIGYITKQSENETLCEDKRVEWEKLLDPESGIPIKLDTDWTDIFWKNKSNDNRIDKIYFAFLNRFFWNELFIAQNENTVYVLKVGKGKLDDGTEVRTIENCNYSYEHLNKDDTSFYYDLTPYKFYDKTIPLDLFKNLDLVLNRFSPNISLCEWDKNFRFIPEYDNNDVTKLTQIHRIVFFAICKYYKENGYYSTSMNRWMRVVWNLVSGDGPDGNPQIRDTQAIRTAIEFISELNSHSAYESLTKYSGELSDTSFDNRCKEEIAKAKQILDEYGKLRKYEGSCKKEDGTSYHTWEEIIVDAEKYAFFKGAIRFLFTDGEGNINWCDFDKKWSTIKKYFDKNGEIVEKYKTNAILLRALISRINIGENWFGYYKMFWHTSLLNSDYKNAIHYLLTTPQLVIEKSCGQDWIIHDSLLHELLCCYNSWHILTSWRGFNVLTRYSQRRSDATSNKEIVVLNDLRNRLLAHKDIVISQEKRVEGTTYLYGWNINFKYNEHFFQWYGPSNDIELDVYLMENDWKDYKKRPNPTENKDTDEDTYFCFRVDMSTTSDTFTDKLNKLIVQADADKQRL